jgi:hypothetical protein
MQFLGYRSRYLLFRDAVAATLVVGTLLWYFADDIVPSRSGSPAAVALRTAIEAGHRRDCARLVRSVTTRTRELLAARLGTPLLVERSLCEFWPGPAKLPDLEPNRLRLQSQATTTAKVSATYTYDIFFGFFGRGRSRYTYDMALEDGAWRVDFSGLLDPNNKPNQDHRANFLAHQTYTAIRDYRTKSGSLTEDADVIRAQLPGFEFPELRRGVASAASPPETPHVALGPDVACVSIRSASGILLMIKLPAIDAPTFEYGAIPAVCDGQPLLRRYNGASSGIR